MYDVNSAYNEAYGDRQPLTLQTQKCVIKDARYSVDSHKYLVAVDDARIFVYKNGQFFLISNQS